MVERRDRKGMGYERKMSSVWRRDGVKNRPEKGFKQ